MIKAFQLYNSFLTAFAWALLDLVFTGIGNN